MGRFRALLAVNERARTPCGENFQQHRVRNAAVEDDRCLDPASTAATQVSTFGIMPPVIVPSAFSVSIAGRSRSVSSAPDLSSTPRHVG